MSLSTSTFSVATTAVLGLAASLHGVTSYSTNFDTFSTTNPYHHAHNINNATGGSVHNQDGWTANFNVGSIDEQIVDLGGGNKALRLSNRFGHGNYNLTKPAPGPLENAGESATGAAYTGFTFSFDFKSALSTWQEGLQIAVTPFQHNSSLRQGILNITDTAAGGLRVEWGDYYAGSFRYTEIADNLSRDDWHSVSVTLNFLDGMNNDTTVITLNGTDHTGLTSWESYYVSASLPVADINNVVFRVPVSSDHIPVGGGLLFDNYSAQVVPEPAALSLLGVGALAMLRRRRQMA